MYGKHIKAREYCQVKIEENFIGMFKTKKAPTMLELSDPNGT